MVVFLNAGQIYKDKTVLASNKNEQPIPYPAQGLDEAVFVKQEISAIAADYNSLNIYNPTTVDGSPTCNIDPPASTPTPSTPATTPSASTPAPTPSSSTPAPSSSSDGSTPTPSIPS